MGSHFLLDLKVTVKLTCLIVFFFFFIENILLYWWSFFFFFFFWAFGTIVKCSLVNIINTNLDNKSPAFIQSAYFAFVLCLLCYIFTQILTLFLSFFIVFLIDHTLVRFWIFYIVRMCLVFSLLAVILRCIPPKTNL